MTIDELIVELGYDLDDRDLKRFRQGLDETEKRAEGFALRMAGFGRAVGIGLTAGAVVAGASVVKFAGVERTLTRLGITADVSRERMAEARQELQTMADDYAFPNMDEPTHALDQMVSRGLSFEQAMANLPAVLATAQASGAQAAEIANSAFSIGDGFGVAADQMQLAFDILAKGGKEGAFELKDMAAVLPSLIPQMKALGYDGIDGLQELVALLQTVRKETGTSAEAATNLQNVLTKLNTETTEKKFEKMGVDLPAEIEANMAAGMTRIDAFLAAAENALQGDMEQITRLMEDTQAQKGLRALLGQREAKQAFLAAVRDDVEGTVETDLDRVRGDRQADIDRSKNAVDRLGTELGATVSGWIGDLPSTLADELEIARRANALKKERGDGATSRLFSYGASSDDELLFRSGVKTDRSLVARHLGPDSEAYANLVRKTAMAGIDVSSAPKPTFKSALGPETSASKAQQRQDLLRYDPAKSINVLGGLEDRYKNAAANIAKLDSAKASTAVVNDNHVSNDNRAFPMNTNVTVNQTVNGAVNAPAAAARATGNAAANAVTQQRARIAATPTTSGNGPQ